MNLKTVLRIIVFAWTVWLAIKLENAHAAEPTSNRLRIVTLGDSITKGVRPGVTANQTFAGLLEKTLRQQGLPVDVANVGIGGERTDGALTRLTRDVLSKKPHVVTVMYGTNDSYVDIGKTDSRLTRETFRANLQKIVTQLSEAGAQVILMTEPRWAAASKKNGIQESPNVRLESYMAECRSLASENKQLLFVDHFAHWTHMESRGVDLMKWTTDGCHPNPAGHEDLAHRIVQVILPVAQRWAEKNQAWDTSLPYRVQLETVSRGYDGQMCWVHPRATAIPGNSPKAILTMQKLLLTGSDVFYALNDTTSEDGGVTWTKPREHTATLGRRNEPDGVEVATCDFTPQWHAKTGKLLGIGQTVRYAKNKVIENRKRETSYSVYDLATQTWSAWTTLAMPDNPKFFSAGAGSVQRVDLPNGDILLPIYFRSQDEKYFSVTVVRCSFDGQKLQYVEHGNELTLESGRGLYEPSLAKFGDRFFLTLRNDTAGYVASSSDGLHFDKPQMWRWDSGEELGNYNTQQHWVVGPNSLYLVYTRRGLHNDHVFRHRAPLLMAQVDVATLRVLRETERILVPERGARLGNFGVCKVSENETWVTVAEWMQTWGPKIIIPPDNRYGADNSVYAARILWNSQSATK